MVLTAGLRVLLIDLLTFYDSWVSSLRSTAFTLVQAQFLVFMGRRGLNVGILGCPDLFGVARIRLATTNNICSHIEKPDTS